MNVYIALAVAFAIFCSGAAGFKVGMKYERGEQADKQQLIAEAVDAANSAAAEAIAKIKIKNTTIKQELEREIRTNTVFTECKLPADSVRLVNQALDPAGSKPAGDSKLPKADAPK